MNQTTKIAVAAAIAAGAGGWFLGIRSSPLPPTASQAEGWSRASSDLLEEVIVRLDKLSQEVASFREAVDGELVPPLAVRSERVPASQASISAETLRELTDSIGAMKAQLDRNEARLMSAFDPATAPRQASLDELKEEKIEVDWAEYRNYISDWEADAETAEESLKFKSDRDLMRRFGPPTEVWSNEKGTHWIYGENYNELTEKYETEIFLRLRDGYVTLVSVESQ